MEVGEQGGTSNGAGFLEMIPWVWIQIMKRLAEIMIIQSQNFKMTKLEPGMQLNGVFA